MYVSRVIFFNSFLFLFLFFCLSCKQKVENRAKSGKTAHVFETDKKIAIDTLNAHELYNYLDSAYLYIYIYFGEYVLQRCGSANIDSVMPDVSKRRVISQDLVLRNVVIAKDSPVVTLRVIPLINDSLLSCNILNGVQFPEGVMFNYKLNRFVQFIYNEQSFLRVDDFPMNYYNTTLKKIIAEKELTLNPKFKSLIVKLALDYAQ
jgi:hypothetical protein